MKYKDMPSVKARKYASRIRRLEDGWTDSDRMIVQQAWMAGYRDAARRKKAKVKK